MRVTASPSLAIESAAGFLLGAWIGQIPTPLDHWMNFAIVVPTTRKQIQWATCIANQKTFGDTNPALAGPWIDEDVAMKKRHVQATDRSNATKIGPIHRFFGGCERFQAIHRVVTLMGRKSSPLEISAKSSCCQAMASWRTMKPAKMQINSATRHANQKFFGAVFGCLCTWWAKR